VYTCGIPFVSSFFFLLSFYCEDALGRPARKETKKARPGGSGRKEDDAHNGRSSGRLKCSGGTALRSCVGQRLALKLKLLAKTYGEQSASGEREEKNGWKREEVGSVGL